MRPQSLLRAKRPMAAGVLGFATLAAGASAAAQAQNPDAITVNSARTHVVLGGPALHLGIGGTIAQQQTPGLCVCPGAFHRDHRPQIGLDNVI